PRPLGCFHSQFGNRMKGQSGEKLRLIGGIFERPSSGLKGQQDHSPGQRRREATPALWVMWRDNVRPVRAKTLFLYSINHTFAVDFLLRSRLRKRSKIL
ncbi:MAG: hypothetical protein ACI4V2_01000, partial [Alloprevotella sp.]